MSEAFYATVTEIKTSLGLNDNKKDEIIAALLPQALDAINAFIGNDLRSTLRTEYADGTGKNFFYTKYYPIISIASIGDDYNHASAVAANNLASSEYIFYGNSGKVMLDPNGNATIGRFCNIPQGIKIVYTSGYATIPRDIAYVFTELVGLWTGLKTKTIIMADGSVMDGVKAPSGVIPKELQTLLAPYVKVKI